MDEIPMFEKIEEIYIQNATYARKPERQGANLITSDIYHIEDVDAAGEKVGINITREVYFEPEGNFDVSVTCHVTLRFNSDLPSIPMRSAVEEAVKANAANIFQLALAKTSLLIAELVNAGGHMPLITPPSFQGVNEDGGGL